MFMSKKLGAEFIGTFSSVLGGCGRDPSPPRRSEPARECSGSAGIESLPAAGAGINCIGATGFSLAFGLTVHVRRLCALGHARRRLRNRVASIGSG